MTREEALEVIRLMKEGMGFSDEENDTFWSYTYDPETKKFSYLEAWTVIGSVTESLEYTEKEFIELLVADFDYHAVTGRSFSRSTAASEELATEVAQPPATEKKLQTVAEAIEARAWDVLLELLAAGAKIPAQIAGADGPLHYAAMFGTVDAVKSLVEHGARVDARGSYGRTPLMYAAADAKSVEMVDFLLKSGADVNAVNEGGDNALFDAVTRDNPSVAVAARLIDAGLDLEYEHKSYKTILCWAANCGRKEIVELLLVRGAKVNAAIDRNESPIAQAMMGKHHDIVKLLLKAGADPESKNYGGWTLLEYATEQKDEDLVRDIIQRTAAKGTAQSDSERSAKAEALAKAAERGDVSMLKLLVEQGADINGINRWGSETALMKAAYYGHADAARWLIDRGADIEARDSRGNTALNHAAWMGKEEVISLLLAHGADTNAVNRLNWNSLMQAALEGHVGSARILLEHGARTDLIDKEKGASVLYLAERSGSQELVALLKAHGAKPRVFRERRPGESYAAITDCEYCQYIPQRKDLGRDESMGDYPGLVLVHSESTEVDRYATSTIYIFQCRLCGIFYQNDDYEDTEDAFISGPSIHRHLQRFNFERLKMAIAEHKLENEEREWNARLPQLVVAMKEMLAREGSAIHPHFLPHFIENVADTYIIANDWKGLRSNLLLHADKKVALAVAHDLVLVHGEGKYASAGAEQVYRAYRHITPEIFSRGAKLLATHRTDFLKVIRDIASRPEFADAAKKVLESAKYYKV